MRIKNLLLIGLVLISIMSNSLDNIDVDVSLGSTDQNSGAWQCGLKPIPKTGYKVGRCVSGKWEQVSLDNVSSLNCGVKPMPKSGHKIGRCVKGQWEQVALQSAVGLSCGLKPIPKFGYRVGRCVNGKWEQISE